MAANFQLVHGPQAIASFDLARLELSKMEPTPTIDTFMMVERTIELSRRTGQLWVWKDGQGFPVGFIAWLRLTERGIDEVKEKRFSAKLRVNAWANRTSGPFLFISEMVAPPHLSGFEVVRAVVRQEKPEWLVGRVKGELRFRKATKHG